MVHAEGDTLDALDRRLLAGELGEVRQQAEQEMEQAGPQQQPARALGLAVRAVAARMAAGEPGGAVRVLDRASEWAEQNPAAGFEPLVRALRARVEVYLGNADAGRQQAESALKQAEQATAPEAASEALRALAELAVWDGDMQTALARWDDALGRLRGLDAPLAQRRCAEIRLDCGEALLDRGGPSDGSDAASRLAAARQTIEAHGMEDLRPPLRMQLARARGSAGDEVGARSELEAVLDGARRAGRRELEWRCHMALSQLHGLRGAESVARRHELAATEVLESIATALPLKLREGFWNDPKRRGVRQRASSGSGPRGDTSTQPADGSSAPASPEPTFHRPGLESRTARLLELIKRLAGEHEVQRLVERITDSAIELSGAERGFVLLLDEEGNLEPWLVRDAGTRPGDPSVAFSRSIAEAVLIDGEPIFTVDARDDRRLSEYLSVHKLMLKSVACLPIQGQTGTVGVLYLEHRMRRGRFREEDYDLLVAFADQAAIALENARLMQENERRRQELEEANRQLSDAKAEIERILVARTQELEETRQELDRTRDELRGSFERHGIVGRSEPMRRLYAVVDRVRETDIPIVIQGESGTGKELVARAIHYGSPRSEKPFVAVNCAAIPEALLESELFGHVRGAFTGADRDRKGMLVKASGGTLFLDEIADMPAKMQVDLLRVLQDGKVTPVGGSTEQEVDVRIISASNRSLHEMVRQGAFREDLFYRLNVVELRLPALRERPEDVPLLCEHFLNAIAKKEGTARKRLSREAMERLASHPLPGNVRQLEHLLLNACVMTEGEVIEPDDLALGDAPAANDRMAVQRGAAAVAAAEQVSSSEQPPAQSLEDYKDVEKQRILQALEEHGWNRARAANALGMPRRTFYRRLREYGVLT